MQLYEKMLRAVFTYRGYNVPVPEQQSLLPALSDALSALSPLQQRILTEYYSTKIPLRSLTTPLGISFSKLNREFHLAMHQLRLAVNRPYREVHESIMG